MNFNEALLSNAKKVHKGKKPSLCQQIMIIQKCVLNHLFACKFVFRKNTETDAEILILTCMCVGGSEVRLFRACNSRHFFIPRNNSSGQKLVVNDKVVSDEHELLNCWANHFIYVSSSHLTSVDNTDTHTRSFGYPNDILEAPFDVEELASAIKKLKSGKSGDANGFLLEHGDHSIILWLQSVFNKILTFEDIPPCILLSECLREKAEIHTTPTTTEELPRNLLSVISKCLEMVLLNRLESWLMDNGFPQYGQTVYQKGISCADAIFSTQEAILHNMQVGDYPTLCNFVLEKAFKYPALLEHLCINIVAC